MSSKGIESFIQDCQGMITGETEANDCAHALAPKMLRLLGNAAELLQPEHLRAKPDGYARNPIYAADDGSLSLAAQVYSPGFWSPVHDHQSWGVIGVVYGVLEEREYEAPELTGVQLEYIDLRPRTLRMYSEGSVFSHLPAEAHIHSLGVPEEREPVVCLHLWGPVLTDRFTYNLTDRSRTLI